MPQVWRPEDNIVGLVLSFYLCVCFKDQTYVAELLQCALLLCEQHIGPNDCILNISLQLGHLRNSKTGSDSQALMCHDLLCFLFFVVAPVLETKHKKVFHIRGHDFIIVKCIWFWNRNYYNHKYMHFFFPR